MKKRMFNLLLFLFPHYLKVAARKGAFKTYINNKYNDGNVRGTIDIARHIKRNIPFVGDIAYNQREYSFDNYLMELIRHAIEHIKSKSYGYNLLNKVKDEVKLVIVSTPKYKVTDRRRVLEANRKNTIRHAYYHEYRELQRLCVLILQNQKHKFDDGHRKDYGILFDGAWLWEEYINSLFDDDMFYHPMNKSGTGAQRLFDGGIGLIYPDFIGRNPADRVIADAKYKSIDNIGNKDYLQVLAYMFRFDSKRGYYLYPDSTESGSKCLMMNEGSTYEGNVTARTNICITKLGLRIPSEAKDYKEFKRQIGDNETAFLKSIE